MPRKSGSSSNGVPRYRKHRASGQAIVTLSGVDCYLGPYGTKTSHREYDRLIAEWLAAGRNLPGKVSDAERPRSFVEVAVAYKRFARGYYRKRGVVTNEYTAICSALKVAVELYGRQPAAEFGPLKLQALQQRMVQRDWSRKHINKQIGRLIRMMRWAASQELVPGGVPLDLRAVRGLAKGRTAARETAQVKPVADEIVNRTLAFLSLTVAAMVQLQRLTGMRPEEVCLLRPIDLDRTSDIWIYKPNSSKMEHHDIERVIWIGPQAQAVLEPWLAREPLAYCFSPREVNQRRREAAHARRATPIGYGNRPGTNRRPVPSRTAGERYTTSSYRRAIHRACEQMDGMPQELRVIDRNLPPQENRRLQSAAKAWRADHCWSPNRLRHSAATRVRAECGLEAAQLILGHQRADVTQVYAERNHRLAAEVARKLG